ncbi:hypothetical protein [Altibacter sp. HG106]|uniref:hypothetical protein n=1 Tax=Altibacter sp. HG106 TaxID=3023937 RepID=UPI002350F527|nr:hypothetical protein [Altibacter sp. HG106]MDC7995063.1 hypothetical protein [Altibacter sp. HG106]
MEVFITKNNSTELKIRLQYNTIAAVDGPPTVAVNFGSPQQKVIPVTDQGDHFLARVVKEELLASGQVKLVNNFMLDLDQLGNKDQIIQNTETDFHFDGGQGEEDHFSHEPPGDVHPGDPQSKSFRISKTIRIVLIPRLKEDMEQLLKELLKQQS